MIFPLINTGIFLFDMNNSIAKGLIKNEECLFNVNYDDEKMSAIGLTI